MPLMKIKKRLTGPVTVNGSMIIPSSKAGDIVYMVIYTIGVISSAPAQNPDEKIIDAMVNRGICSVTLIAKLLAGCSGGSGGGS